MRRNQSITASILATASVLFLSSADALGYSYNESPDGDPVRWLEPKLTVVLDVSLARLGEVDEVRDTLGEALAVWTDAVDFPFDLELAQGECGEEGAKIDGVSCIFVGDTAPANNADAGATTFVRYRASNGSISEVDVVFYESAGPWSSDGSASTLDLFAVASHEAGHLFGLGHSDVSDARMYPSIVTGDQWAGDLSDDDIDGADALYEGVEYKGESDSMSCSASVAPGRPGSMSSFIVMFFALGLICLRKCRP